MEEKPKSIQDLEKKYIKTYDITDYKDLLEKMCNKYKTAKKMDFDSSLSRDFHYIRISYRY